MWEESLLVEVFVGCISSPSHLVLVAIEDDEIAGFLSVFLAPKPLPRWEMDLIAVRPKSQGRGIGTYLVKEAFSYGSNQGARLARASIHVNNYSSQCAFAKAGFATDSRARILFLWEPLASDRAINVPEAIHLIPVNTLTYRGLWIEGFVEAELDTQEQRNMVCCARSRISHENRLYTGTFVPEDLKGTIAPDLLNIASDHGQYHWWEHSLT